MSKFKKGDRIVVTINGSRLSFRGKVTNEDYGKLNPVRHGVKLTGTEISYAYEFEMEHAHVYDSPLYEQLK